MRRTARTISSGPGWKPAASATSSPSPATRPSPAVPAPPAPMSWPRMPRPRHGSAAAAAAAPRVPGSMTGRSPRCQAIRTVPRQDGPGTCWSAARSPATLRASSSWPTTCAALPPQPLTRTSSRWPGPAGPSKNASRPPKPKPGSITTRSAATTPGTGTSPWPCWRTPTCPSRRRPPQKPWQRPHPGHDRRGQTSPGTLNRPASRPQRSLGLVSVAQTPPAPCQSQPLPAKTGQLQRSAAGVLVTRRLPREALDRIEARCDMTLYDGEGAMPRDQLLTEVARKAGAITLLTDRVDDEFLNAAGPQLKIVANYAVGFDNID